MTEMRGEEIELQYRGSGGVHINKFEYECDPYYNETRRNHAED